MSSPMYQLYTMTYICKPCRISWCFTANKNSRLALLSKSITTHSQLTHIRLFTQKNKENAIDLWATCLFPIKLNTKLTKHPNRLEYMENIFMETWKKCVQLIGPGREVKATLNSIIISKKEAWFCLNFTMRDKNSKNTTMWLSKRSSAKLWCNLTSTWESHLRSTKI